ncbi:hypothetical protein L218DRAFT_1078236, partial [Marasmius fiardii PR-910]
MLSIHRVSCRSRFSSLPRHGTRHLTSGPVAPRPLLRGSVIVENVPTPSYLSTVLDRVQIGPIDRIQHEPLRSLAFLDFIDPGSAEIFCKRFRERAEDTEGGPTIAEKYSTPSAWPVAAIGYYRASRCITILYPKPPNTTEDSLKEDLSRFGPVEKVETFNDASEGTYKTIVHFNSIESALQAMTTLRKEEGLNGARIHFRPDRFDLSNQQPEGVVQEENHAQISRHVYLTGFDARPSTLNGVLNLIEKTTAPFHVHGEALQNITVFKGKRKPIFLSFMRPEDAVRFVDTFNSQSSLSHNKKPKAHSHPLSRPEKGYKTLHLSRAVGLGATRTLLLTGIRAWDRKGLHEDFSRFGHITKIFISKSEHGSRNRALITFNDIHHATKAIAKVYADNQSFQRYVGTKISFFQRPQSTVPPPLPIFIR